ncbi:hypothetical protein F4678DRAFT_123104 [Xylaria arbuscula]|nr:hypothetical protein F4678DRAFT_123104 [Xylaria arbuscula]
MLINNPNRFTSALRNLGQPEILPPVILGAITSCHIQLIPPYQIIQYYFKVLAIVICSVYIVQKWPI